MHSTTKQTIGSKLTLTYFECRNDMFVKQQKRVNSLQSQSEDGRLLSCAIIIKN